MLYGKGVSSVAPLNFSDSTFNKPFANINIGAFATSNEVPVPKPQDLGTTEARLQSRYQRPFLV